MGNKLPLLMGRRHVPTGGKELVVAIFGDHLPQCLITFPYLPKSLLLLDSYGKFYK